MEKHNFLLILVFLVQFSVSVASSNVTDQEALLAFRDLIRNPDPFVAKNWTTNTSFCSWFGVTCSSKRERVVALALPNMQLRGTISPSLANLSFLRVLDLGYNFLNGNIPYGLGHLPRLRVIDVQNNQLQGSIPKSLFQHPRIRTISLASNNLGGEMWTGQWYAPELRVLDLRNNSLRGMIPPSVENATKLLGLSLASNQLTGSIPAALLNISSLLHLNLANNSLSGPLLLGEVITSSSLEFLSISMNQISGFIPSNICQLPELKSLSISYNNITGEIPRDIGCLAKLEEFYTGINGITGAIPASLGNISALQYLHGSRNRMEGPVPPELGKLSNLRELSFALNDNLIGEIPKAVFNISSLETISFGHNNLSGRIPATIGLHLPNLRELFLGANQLEGKIPPYITNASNLESLALYRNFLTGSIPTNLGNLHVLRNLFLHTNQLTSEHENMQFLSSLVGCRMLRYLELGFNPLNGVLPSTIGNLSSTIEDFNIQNAHIYGPVPAGIGNISGLTAVWLHGNNLNGTIPSEVGKLKQLQGLFLSNNKLQGHIPEVICDLSDLVRLTLDGNELSGMIPECIGNLSMLQDLWLSSNKLASKFPLRIWKMSGLLSLDVSQNSIQGEVPQDIGQLKAIIDLNLSGNHFSGMIPRKFGDLQNLKSLDLSNNSFSGPIPLSFANLISLEFLDLSLNSMSGAIPKSLEKLSHLKSINVSFNDLEGEIPSGGVFVNSTPQCFLGNKNLCGMHTLNVPVCAISSVGQQSKSKKLVLKIVTPVVVSSFLIFVLASICIMKWKRKGKSKGVQEVAEIGTYQLASYQEIQRATDNFDGSNLIGVGGSSSVYKGTLFSGTVVAIKVLNLQNEEVCKRFDTECEVMRNVRHRNLVTVITTCSSEHIRAFVLQYMPNGSLDYWLYQIDCHLNLLQRASIMHDVAMAMEYLHHGYHTPIVHCDLKPANVLLDEDMVAHVGDFGITKILAASKFETYTETLGTLGYIAPEYGLEGIVSTSGDVYSYGIMLMEVLTKRRPTGEEIYDENHGLREWIRRAFPGTVMEVVDRNLFHEKEQITSQDEVCVASMIELALDCTTEKPESRITMKDVVKRLYKIKTHFWER